MSLGKSEHCSDFDNTCAKMDAPKGHGQLIPCMAEPPMCCEKLQYSERKKLIQYITVVLQLVQEQ